MPHLFDPSKIVDGKSHTKRHLEKVRTWVTKRMPQTGKAPKVSCKEVLCGDPTCAPVDTVIDLLFEDQSRMVALPYEAQDVTEEILDHLFPPSRPTAWMNGEDAAWPLHQMTSCGLRWAVAQECGCREGPLDLVTAASMVHRGAASRWLLRPHQVELDMGNLIFADDLIRCIRAF